MIEITATRWNNEHHDPRLVVRAGIFPCAALHPGGRPVVGELVIDTGASHSFIRSIALPGITLTADGIAYGAEGRPIDRSLVRVHTRFHMDRVDELATVTCDVPLPSSTDDAAIHAGVLGLDMIQRLVLLEDRAQILLRDADESPCKCSCLTLLNDLRSSPR